MSRRDIWVMSITIPLLLAIVVWIIRLQSVSDHITGNDVALISASGPPSATPSPSTTGTVVIQPLTAPTTGQRVVAAPAWVAAIAARTGIPARALAGYADAALAIGVTRPQCHLTWTMLAGIGAIESGHGQHGGAQLRADGTTTIPILGPALDGTHGNRAVPATAEGVRLDGDPRWDHAVGPMQFIPSTWSHWGVSASGGVPNPNSIDDASLTAGDYLCSAGGDLRAASGWQAAVRAYNSPAAYEIAVTNAANRYARASVGP
jgi:membrane-bound lytic murein transglycosylase B